MNMPFNGVLFLVLSKRIDDMRDLLRAEMRALETKVGERTRHILDKIDELDSRLTRLEERR
jgi:hypothetical protein